jgi:phage protein D/phage baseplate assembly protein gpV
MAPSQGLPAIDIDAAGVRLPDRCARGFSSMLVQQRLSQPSACELVFTGLEDGLVENALPIGATLTVTQRDVGAALFEGRVSAIEYGHDSGRTATVAVRAYDALFVLRNRQSVRAHVGLTAADLARELVKDLGLGVEAQVPGPVWQRLLQTGSDFDLLADVAARCGLYLAVQDGALVLLTLEGRGPLQMLRLNENLLDARLEVNGSGACRTVRASGWDPWRSVARSGTASAARSGRDVSAKAPASQFGGGDARDMLAMAFQDDAQAQARAQAELDARSAQEVVFQGTTFGDPRLRPGARVHVSGVASRVAGEYVLASVRHTLDVDRGFQSDIDSALPPPRPRLRGTTMTLGSVASVDDPDRLGRLQVALPGYADLVTDWLQFLSPGAGGGKGLVAPPDVGDLVLLLIDLADPSQAVVLGSLYGEGGLPAGHDVLGKNASFCFLTPGGQRIRLDDDKRTVRIENRDGSVLQMAPDEVKLHAATRMMIEAPGQKLVIRAQSIDFERA